MSVICVVCCLVVLLVYLFHGHLHSLRLDIPYLWINRRIICVSIECVGASKPKVNTHLNITLIVSLMFPESESFEYSVLAICSQSDTDTIDGTEYMSQ